ncbi:hypothetical protein F5Y16DRAFT_384633 [Xylariaceae sp. FL0255]|nr:hypothetical protein F5Y16DRAFT_384633 [Xylariaceae sp. FL0255]
MFGQKVSSILAVAAAATTSVTAQITQGWEDGWNQTEWPIYAPDCNQGGTVALDSTTAHSGQYSIKVTGASGYCGHIFVGTTAVPAGDFYVRVWLKATTALGADHVTFITMPDAAQGTDENLRMGGQSSIMMYNRESDDATLPDLSPQGIATSEALPTGSWECLEYYVGSNGSLETWLNNATIVGMTEGISGVTNPNDQGWTRNLIDPKIQGVYFGWESYSGDVNTFWYDDIAIATSRVGCS